MVVWTSNVASGDPDFGIVAQRFASDGTAVGGEFSVNTFTTGSQFRPRVEMRDPGAFFIVWGNDSVSAGDADSGSLAGRRFDSAGAPIGDDFQINAYTMNNQFNPDVAIDAAGDFVATWNSFGSFGDDNDLLSIQARHFRTAGS